MPQSASLAHLQRRISDKKWKLEAHEWSLGRIKNPRFNTKRFRQTTDPTPAKAPKRRRPILPAENRTRPYGYSPEVDQTAGGRPVLVVLPIQIDPGALVQALQPMASPA